jgi:hypothetical protein
MTTLLGIIIVLAIIGGIIMVRKSKKQRTYSETFEFSIPGEPGMLPEKEAMYAAFKEKFGMDLTMRFPPKAYEIICEFRAALYERFGFVGGTYVYTVGVFGSPHQKAIEVERHGGEKDAKNEVETINNEVAA